MAKKQYQVCVERYEYIFEQLEQLKVQEMMHLQEDMVDDDLEMNENSCHLWHGSRGVILKN